MLKVVIAAAGKGSRSKLNYPKTLFKIDDIPILIRILRVTSHFDEYPLVIVSKEGIELITKTVKEYGFSADFIVQEEQLGMGDAVLYSRKYKKIQEVKDCLLLWGDLPFIKKSTLSRLIHLHKRDKSDFSFPTLISDDPYTLVKRDEDEAVFDLQELKNVNTRPKRGERDIGIFIYKPNIVIRTLNEIRDLRIKGSELGFLEIVKVLFKKGYSINAYNIAEKKEGLSFNSKEDIKKF